MILVTGAAGQLGQVVVESLLKRVPASQIAVLVRDDSKVADWKTKGISVRVGDYHNTSSLASAMLGIEKVLLISSNDFNDRIGQHKNVVNAAKNAGIKHILYTGVTMKDIQKSPLKPLLEDHYQTEDYIQSTGLTYTFLRNSLYAEVIPMFVGEKVLETGVFFPAGDGKVPFVTRQDLGEATALVLTTEGHENKIYPFVGSNAYSFNDVATILSTISGKEVNYTSPESAAFEGMLKSFGLPDMIVTMSVLFAAAIKNTDFEVVGTTLEDILGHQTTDLASYLKTVFAA